MRFNEAVFVWDDARGARSGDCGITTDMRPAVPSSLTQMETVLTDIHLSFAFERQKKTTIDFARVMVTTHIRFIFCVLFANHHLIPSCTFSTAAVRQMHNTPLTASFSIEHRRMGVCTRRLAVGGYFIIYSTTFPPLYQVFEVCRNITCHVYSSLNTDPTTVLKYQ